MSRSQQDSKTKGRYVRHDAYYQAAKQQGYVARSVYKLEEIDKASKLIGPKNTVLDLGCAPGSWLQYAADKVTPQGRIVGIDLLPVKIALGPHVHILLGDMYELDETKIRAALKLNDTASAVVFDVVLSDMAPNTTGIRSVDQDRSLALCEQALSLAAQFLKPGGRFCVKILEGGGIQGFVKACREVFQDVKIKRPKGTRPGSTETYIVGLNKKRSLAP